MRAFLLVVVLLICSISTASSQSLSVFSVDASGFPVVKARFIAFDAGAQQARPSASEITVSEDGVSRTVLSVACPPQQPAPPVSLAMSIDISGSMGSSSSGAVPVELGKTTVRSLVPLITDPSSEFALQTCNDRALLIQDFTTHRDRIISALPDIQAGGGNDFVEHLLNPLTGLLNIAKSGRQKRIALLYTDAWWPALSAADLQRCKDTCSSYGIKFFAVIYSSAGAEPNGIKVSLRELAESTGGELIDGVTSQQGAGAIAARLQQQAEAGEHCEIIWQSGTACRAGVHIVSFAWKAQTAQGSYTPPPDALLHLSFDPSSIFFRSKPVGVRFDTTITVRAMNAAFNVSGITTSNPAYDINPKSFALTAGESRTLTVSYTPPDSGLTWTTFDFRSNLCAQTYYASGGYRGVRPVTQTLKIEQPNGGEILPAGGDTMITWSGISPMDSVRLEFSSDNGSSWTTIIDRTSGGSYLWRVPATPSAQCLVRVTQIFPGSGSDTVLTLAGHFGAITSVAWSPDGRRVATASWDRSAIVWDAKTGVLLQTLKQGKLFEVFSVAWSADGSKVVTTSGNGDYDPKIWDVNGAKILLTLSGHSNNINSVAWSADGSRVVTGSNDNTAKIWDPSSGTLIRTLVGHAGGLTSVAWSADGSMVATASNDKTAILWDANSGAVLRTLIGHASFVTGVGWSPDGSHVVTSCNDGITRIWDASNGALIRSFAGHAGAVMGVDWSPDGSMVATAGSDRTAKIWDASFGTLLQTFTGHNNVVTSIAWSPDGTRVATGSYGAIAKIWGVDPGMYIQSDISDRVFSIVLPQPHSINVDMGKVLVGTSKDSVIPTFVSNNGSYPFNVTEIQITGTDASQFSFISGIPPFTVSASGSHPVEFRFHPTSTGIKSAQLLVIAQGDTLRQTISGEGIAPSLAVTGNVIDFGQLEIGSSKDTTIGLAIRNIGTASVAFSGASQLGPDMTQFSLLSGGGAFTLAPGKSLTVTLRFTPHFIGRTSGRIGFEYNGVGSPAVLQVFGQGLGGLVSVTDDSAFAGEHRDIRLRLEKVKATSLQSVAATNFRARISYDRTILNPVGGSVSRGERYDTLTVTGSLGTDDLLAQVPFVAMLGDREQSSIDIVDFEWLDDQGTAVPYDVETQSGRFHLLGVCQAGGARLLNPDGQVQILKIAPNPTSEQAELEIETLESGRTRVVVMDMLGREVATVFDGELASGRHLLAITTKELAEGAYYVMLTTPTVRCACRIDIVK